MRKPLILIDPGHGGQDPGAVNHSLSIRESYLNLRVSLRLHDILNLAYVHPALLTRAADSTLSLEARVERQKTSRAKYFVSLHFNSAPNPARGFEVWTYPDSKRAKTLAWNVLEFLKEVMPNQPDRGLKQTGHLYVLKHTDCPAILVEFGFINHPEFCRWATKDESQNQLAWAVARGLIKTIKQAETNKNDI